MRKLLETALIEDLLIDKCDASYKYLSFFCCTKKESAAKSEAKRGRKSAATLDIEKVFFTYIFAKSYKSAFSIISDRFFFETKKSFVTSHENKIFSFYFVKSITQAKRVFDKQMQSHFWTIFGEVPTFFEIDTALEVAIACLNDSDDVSKILDVAYKSARIQTPISIKNNIDFINFKTLCSSTYLSVEVTDDLIIVDDISHKISSIFKFDLNGIKFDFSEVEKLIGKVTHAIIFDEKIAKIVEDAAKENGDFIIYSYDIAELSSFVFLN